MNRPGAEFSQCLISLSSLLVSIGDLAVKQLLHKKVDVFLDSYLKIQNEHETSFEIFKKNIDELVEFVELISYFGSVKRLESLSNLKNLLNLKLAVLSSNSFNERNVPKTQKLPPKKENIGAQLFEEIRKNSESVNNQVLFQKFSRFTRRTIRRHLSRLVEEGKIIRLEEDGTVSYRVMTDI